MKQKKQNVTSKKGTGWESKLCKLQESRNNLGCFLPYQFISWMTDSYSGLNKYYLISEWNLPGGSDGKESACNVGDLDLIPGLGRSPGERNGNPLQYFCLENNMGRGAWWATVCGVTKSWMRLRDLYSRSEWNLKEPTSRQGYLRATLWGTCLPYTSFALILSSSLLLLP